MTRSYLLLLALFLIGLWLFSPHQASAYPVDDAQKLQQAWRLAQTVGRFHYQTDVIQTTHPAITLRNANRHAKTKQFQVAGEMDLPNNRMALQIQTKRAGQSQVIDLKVEAGQAYGRLNAQADWTPIDQSTDLFAPGGDPLGFLAAAENVEEIGGWRPETNEQSPITNHQSPISNLSSDNLLDQLLPADYLASLTRYRFDLNGVKYAEFMRAQMEESLRRQGELPNGMKLDLVRQYVDMTGSGEIWVDEDGLPVRQLIQLQFPPEGANGEWVEATVTTAFRQWQPSPVATLTTLWQEPAQMPRLLLNGVGITPWALQEAGIVLLLCLVIGSLAGLIIYYRRSRLLYTSVTLSLIGSLLAVPVFNAQQVYAFSERQQTKAATSSAEKATQDQLETLQADQKGWNFDPQRNPLTTTDLASSGLGEGDYATRNSQLAARITLLATTCDMTTDTDCDDDGLSNEAEVNKLGTDPYAVDSDNDYISDKAEVQGFTFGGKQWYLDPLNPDSNGDGLLDSLECPGLSDINLQTDQIDSSFVSRTCLNSDSATTNSDLVPDVFDFDNDGDGVPDTVDDSPYTVVGNTSTGLTDSKLNFNLTFTGANQPIYVDFTVRPTNADHLWYTNNVLDWPNNDSTGQITRVFDTTYADTDSYSSLSKSANGDMLLIPLLEFEIPYNAANPSAGLPIASGYSAAAISDYSDLTWLDTDALDELGISVNEGEEGQSLLLWVPLSLAQDDVGDTPVAWEGRMLYRPVTGLSNLGQDQRVRLVWMVQALVDTCDVSTSSTSLTSAELVEAWCADKSHWTTGTSVIQTYYDDFMLTGLSVREDHGAKVAIIAEPKTVGNSNYEDRLWHLADSLESAFLGAEGKASTGSASDRFSVTDIAGYATTWGLSGLTINTYTLDNQLDLASVASTYSTDLLNSAFGSAASGDSVSLLFAGEETARTAALTDAATSISGNTVKLTLTGATLATQANLRWAPYQYKGAQVWDTLDLESYLDTLDSEMQSVFTNSQIDLLVDNETVADYPLLRAGASGLAQNYYLSLFSGLSKTVAEDGNRFSSTALGNYTLGSTEPVTAIVKALLVEIQNYYAELAVVDGVATTSDATAANSLAASFATSLNAILEALGNVAQGNVTTALSLALSELANYYKTTNVATTQFTDVGSITAAAWSSTVSYAGSLVTGLDFLYGAVSAGMAAYTILWGVRAFNAYSSYMALANFTHFQPGASNPTAAFTYAAKADSVVKTNVAWAVVTFVITVAIIWTLFALGKYDNHLQRNAAIVKAVADTIVALIMAVIAAIPVFGWIIVGVVSLISALMMIVCAAVGVESGSDVDRWVCGGLTGALSQAIVYAIYDQYIVPDLNDSDRLSIALNTPTLSQKLDDSGYLAGNQLTVSATVTNTISKAQPTGLGSKEHFGYDLDDLLKKSTFAYTLQTTKTDRHASLKAGALDWTNKREVFYPSVTIDFDSPGLNQNLPLYLTESFVAPALECWGFLIQVCGRSDYKDSFHTYLGEDIVFDILPATLDEFYALTLVKNKSYRLGWDNQFPTLIDADGDGLVSKAKGGADPDDQLWDTDSDGLSDFWELENGFDPEHNDYDGDGLYDYWEAFYNTDPHLADSDRDGLSDSEEFFHSGSYHASVKDSSTWSGGWTFVYAYSGSTKLQTRVNADPNDYDSDDDTIGDRLEYVYGYNPNLASVLNVLSLDAETSATVIAPGDGLVYTATVKNELDNRVANGLLQAEFPVDTVQKTQVMATLYPQDSTTITGSVTAPTVSATTATSLTLRAGAIIDEVDTGRVLWLHLNENANVSTFTDDAQSENGPHDATCTAANGVCPGANGSFLNFDGSNDLLTISHDDEFNLTNFTASLWVKLDTIKAQTFLAKGTTGLTIGTTSFGQAYASIRLNDCATTVTVRSSALLVTGSWHNLVATYNGTTLAFYLNGVSAGSASAASLCTNSSSLTLGSSNGGNYFAGQMDEVEIYTEGKSAAEVATLAQKPVFYLSGYRTTPYSGYQSNDESDYRAVTVACVASASNTFTCPSEAVGIAGDSFVFNQSHGLQVSGSDLLDLDAVDGSFSMALWLYPESGYTPDDNHLNNYGQMILGNDDNGWQKAYPSLYIKGNKLIVRFGHADGNGYCEATSGDIFSYNNWQYLTVTFDGSQFKAYIGDTLKSTFSGSNCAGQSLYATTSFYIGNGRSPALYFTQLEVDNDPQNDEAFLWSDETLLNNGYGVQELIWESVDHDIDSNDTLAINKWAYNTDSNFSFIFCNEDATATQGCTGKNDYITLDGSTTKTVNFYDSLGAKDVRVYNAHGDGSGDRHTWHGWLSYKLYNNAFKGQLDEIKLYRTALSADAVSAAYNGSVQSLELTFDEAPGQDIFSDSSGNAYDATCSTTSAGGSCPDSGIPGRANQAGRFDGGVADDDGTDGVGDYLKLENTDLLGLKDSSFTVLAWVKPDSLTGDRAILGTDGNQPQKGLHLILRNGKPYFGFFNMDTAGSSTIATDQWTHLAWRYDKENLTQSLYVNGVLDTQGTGKAAFLGTGPVYLGRALGGNYFDGLIDHLVIVKEALTDDEIADVMQEAPTLNLHLDEDLNATRFVNDSLYGNDATCASASSACPQAGAKGQMREAPVFDGNDLLTTNLTGYVADPRNISVAFWVKPTQTKSTVQYLYQSNPFNLFLKANSTDLGVDVGYSSNNSTCSVGSTADLSVSLQKNQWNHVVVTLASTDTSYTKKGTLTVYVNGAAQSAATKAYTCPTLATINLGQSFEGSLDELLLYNSVLADETVQSLYAYQSAWYDLRYQQLITIDADDPLLSIEMSADYLDYQAYWFTFSAVDTGSSVATVQVALTRPDNSVTTGYATASADSTANNAWLYEFTPTSSGRYVIEVTATDTVGNSSSASKTFYIDDTAPTITLDSALTSAILTTTTGVATHDLALAGTVSDSGSPTSGVVTNTVSVDLLDHQDVSVSGIQYATVTGSAWQVAYPFTTLPYGQYRATLRAADLAGNTITTTVGPLNLDDLGPTADIALSSSVISESVGTLSGVVTDIPYPSEDRARYLHFEEESSATTFVDSTSNGVIVTCTDCPTAGATGQSGHAATFDGVNDRLTLSAPFDPAASKFTAAAWFKVADLTTPHTLLAQADGTGAGRAWLLVTTAGTLASDLGGSRLSSVDSVSAGQWHHAALTYDGTTLSLYLDGTLTAQADRSLESSDGELVLGADGTQTQDFFAGLLDETVIYHRALSAEELYDIAHPLATTVASASIRFRHAADGDQGEGEGSWTPVTLFPSTGSGNADPEPVEGFATWQYPLPAGLEGPYKIDLKATDSIGNSSYIPGVWSGDIDTLAPRISFSYTLLSDTYMQVECLADDYNVTLDGWDCPAASVSEVPEDDAWFIDLFDPYTRTTSLQSPLATLARAGRVSGTLNVCDEVGHCSSQTIASPTMTAEASAIVTPSGATTYHGLDPIALAGYVRSTDEVRDVDVTIDGVTIYSLTWSSGITEATWSTVWTPTKFGAYTLEATMTNGLGQSVSDPVDTVLTVVAPELTVDKTVTPSSRLRTGDAITYTVVFANRGDATAANVLLSDTLPSAVTGSNLAITRDLASGESVTYTVPAVVAAGDAFTVTNTALISHTWQQRTASASFTRCDDLLVTNANDSGAGSLRQAISDACTADAVIRFADDFNIYLNSTLSINKGVTIDGEDHTIVLSGDSDNNGSRNVQVLSIGASGVVTLTSLQVVSGTAIWGGGIANAGVLVITDSYFRDNYSNSNLGGGAIYNSKTLTVTGSTFVKNQSSRGGALFNGGTATLINSTLTQNSATEGSGIHNRGTLTLRNVTAVAGGNLHNWSGKLYLYNSLLANNSAADCYGGGAVVANVNNLIRTGNCGTSITSDPVLGALTAFPSTGAGNEQWVMPLLPGSPALNTGDSATCAATDQRGQPRTGGCDIGAFQSQGFTFTLAGGDNQATLIKSNFTQPLAFTVTAQAATEPVSGGKVTLTAPGSGASLQSSSQSLTVGSNGTVTTTATANGVTGAYTVTAAIGAANADLALTLTNRSPDLVITKAVTPTSAVGGDLITYTLAVSNTGDLAATNVTMTDTLPSGVTVQEIRSSGTLSVTNSSSAGQERFTIATFPAGASGLITLTAEVSGTVTTSDVLTNTATIGWAGAEEDLSDNVASISNTIPCQPAISVTNGNNSGGGSLRQAIANLCAGGTITFADDTTIYLDSVLTLNNTLSIDGSGHAVTISGDSGHDDDRDVQIFTISASGVVTLSNLSVISGTAEVGGAINNAGALTLDHITLQDNRATSGGALYNQGAVTLTAVALHSNNASDSGSALYNSGRATVDSAMLTGNQATNNGTIYNDGVLTVQNSTFADNHNRRGGGIYNSTGYTATVTNSTFGHNGTSEGGGIHNRGVLTVTNSTFANNSGYGSAIHNWTGILYLRNSVLTGTCVNQGTLASSVNNFVSNGGCSAAYAGTPYLSTLGNYGGPLTGSGTALQTFALLPGSPAFDRGAVALCPTTDQRGVSRASACDIGAFESQGFTMVYADGSNQSVDAGLSFSAPLAVTITANAAAEPVGPGGLVSFTAPASGAGLSTVPLTGATDSTGVRAIATANTIAGSYLVTATAAGVTTTAPVTFSLTNNVCIGATVTNANDSGAGSLRQAITEVCPGGVITFDNDYTIYLSSTLTINKVVTINGAGHAIIISGDIGGNGTKDLRPLVIGASGVVTLTRLSIMHGTATTGSALSNGGTLTLDTVTVANNYAASTNSANLGTLYNVGTLTVQNSTFAHNETYRGGGIYHQSGTATVTNSTFAENTATEGGGIYNRSTMSVINSTFADNTTRYAEGIQNAGTLTLINSLFKGKALNIPNCSGNASPVRLNNRSDDPFCGTSYYSTSLRLTALGDQGGSSTGSETAPQTVALQSGSSAIDAGNAAYCPATDQRGYPRLGTCDVGATEWQGYRLVVSGGDNQRAGLNNPFPAPLQVTLVAAESGDTVPTGRTISFNAPTSDATLDSNSFSATTDDSNLASANVTANGISGSYVVTATASDVITPVSFALTNDCGLVTVTNDSDSGPGTLRQALSEACDGGTITFADDYTIYLASTLAISKTLTIDGVGHTVTVSGDTDQDSTNDVRVFAIDASGVVTISHLTVANGFVNDENGAGINNEGVLTLLNSTVRDNLLTGDASGGGLANSGTVTIRNSTLSDNAALDSSDGGGLTNYGLATVVNSTFSGNQAAADGGAIRNVNAMSINNSTLVDNSSASSGGGLYNSGDLTLRNTIIANSASGGDCVDGVPLTANSNNLIADGSCSPALSGDPNLAALGDYGGPSTSSGAALQTFALLPGSPALNAGDDTTCEITDQRGLNRVGVCDIGATEAQGFTWSISGGNHQGANRDALFAEPLQVTLIASDTNLLLDNQTITFTAPSIGAGLDTSSFTALSDSSGVAAAAVTANSVEDSYVVTATALGFSPPLTFTLTNLECYNQMVTTDADSGPGSLRQAIADACDGALITFAGDYAIYLDSTLSINKTLTIDGEAHAITVSGDSNNNGGCDVQIFKIEASGLVTMTHLAIVDGSDSSASEYGAGINNNGTLTLNQVTLANNVGRRFGGAIHNNGTLTVNDSVITDNDGGDYGGGLLNYTTATINNSLIASNQATDWGGGLLNYDTLILVNSILRDNAADSGGALYSAGASTVVSNSTFTANTAFFGGAIDNQWNLTLVNSTLSGNTASDYGGGIYNIGYLTLINNTISDNAAMVGGGIFHEGYSEEEGDPSENATLTFVNTIIANSVSGGDCVNSAGIVEDNGYNLIEDGTAVADGGCLDNASSRSGEPWLAQLDYYGGPSAGAGAEVVQTHELLPNSPALNGGDESSCPATDQRGFARLGICDIGAVESQGFSIDIAGGDQQTTLVDTDFPDPLDVSLNANNDYLVVGEGQIVTFTAPASGASLTSPIFTGTTDVDNWISIPVAANSLAGRYAVTATVNNLLTPARFTLTNTDGNNAPALDPVASQTISETYALSFTVTASDPAGDGLTFSLSDAPTGATFDDATGRFTWTPTDEQGPGIYTMTVTVTDDGAPVLSESAAVVITVLDLPLAFAQALTTDEDQGVDFTLFALAANDPITYTLVSTPSHGALSGVAPDLTYTPDADYAGSDRLTFLVSDGLVASTIATVTLTVNPINETPTAVEQTLTVQEDTPLTITLSASDPDGDALTYTVAGPPQNGALSGSAPNLVYTPDADYVGDDSFTFTVSDGISTTAEATITITVTAVDDAPIADDQQVTVTEDTVYTITLTGSDRDSTLLDYNLVATPDHGAASTIGATLVYTPDGNYSGSDRVLFNINDASSYSNNAVVTITVVAVNDAPIADADTFTTTEDAVTTLQLTAADPEGDVLTYTIVTAPQQGELGGIAPDLVYTPTADFNGSDSFTFQVSDGLDSSTVATVELIITPANDAPLVLDQVVNTDEDQPVAFTLTGFDTENDGLTYTVVTLPVDGALGGLAPNLIYTPTTDFVGSDSLTFTVTDGVETAEATIYLVVDGVNDTPTATDQGISTPEETALAITLQGSDQDGDALTYHVVTPPAHGVVDGVAPDLVYLPDLDYAGSDSLTFRVNDGAIHSLLATVAITVTPVNDAPIADSQTITTSEEQGIPITLTGADVDSGVLIYTVLTPPDNGALGGLAPALVYTPTADFTGSDRFTFAINDGITSSLAATVTIVVTEVNDAPLADSQSVSTTEESAVAITLTASDAEGEALTYTVVTQPVNGTLGGIAPNLLYTPTADFNGADAFAFTVDDGVNDSAVATVTLTVNPVNDAPTTDDQMVTTAEETPLAITLTGDDRDGDGLTYTVVMSPTNGTLGGTAPTLVYTPMADFNGTDHLLFAVSDGSATKALITATVWISVTAVNDAPTVAAQSAITLEDIPLAITLAGSDADGDTLSYAVVTQPVSGTLGGIAPNLVYTPTADFNGTDSFTFFAGDGLDDSLAATVAITVTPVNDPPTPNTQSLKTYLDTSVALTLAGSDLESTALTYTVATQPVSGTLGGIAPNLVYTPSSGFTGVDTFTFAVTDDAITNSRNASAPTATITITVLPLNNAPTVTGQSATTDEDTNINLMLTGADPDGDPLTYTVVEPPQHGAVSGVAPDLLYAPADEYDGNDSFTFMVSDGITTSQLATVSLTINAVNDSPSGEEQTVSTYEDVAVAITLTGGDIESTLLTYTVAAQPLSGTLGGIAPNLVYTPATHFYGSDAFTFILSDGITDSVPATVTVVVTPVNDAPVATGQGVTTTATVPVSITLTGTDVEGAGLTYLVATQPLSGTLGGIAPNLVYTPNLGFAGTDRFTFQVNDGLVDSIAATVLITVTNNTPPTATSTVTPTPSATPSVTPTPTTTATETATATATETPLPPPTVTDTATATPTASPTATETATETATATTTATPIPTVTATPTAPSTATTAATATHTATVADTPTSTASATASVTEPATPTATATATMTPSVTTTATATALDTGTPTSTTTGTPTTLPTTTATATTMPTATPTIGATVTATATTMPTATATATATPTLLPTITATVTSTPTAVDTATMTVVPTNTAIPTATQTATVTPWPSATPTTPPTTTPTGTVLPTATATPSATATMTVSATPTATSTALPTATLAPTATSTPAPTATPTFTATVTASPTASSTPSATAIVAETATATNVAIATATATALATLTPTSTSTLLPTVTATPTHTATTTPTATDTPAPTATPTFTATLTATPTVTDTATATVTPTATASATALPALTPTPTTATGPTLVDLEFTVTLGIWGLTPQCTGLSTMMVPANTTVIYCYNVHNGTSQTPTIHTLTDSQWGVLLNQLHLTLPPGRDYSYAITRTITATTTNTATWTAIQPELSLMARSNLGDKTVALPSVLTPQWQTAWLLNPGPQWSTNRSTSATVYVSGPTDDQDHDGIPDNVESAADFDGDNLPNFLDEDADNDGKPDTVEGIVDQDQDGQMDFVDFENSPPDPTNIELHPQEPVLSNKVYLPFIVREE